ncbi:MAG: hypothetical protein ACYYK0_04760 [Candidatus Eutrophobiaceae bacterium]
MFDRLRGWDDDPLKMLDWRILALSDVLIILLNQVNMIGLGYFHQLGLKGKVLRP